MWWDFQDGAQCAFRVAEVMPYHPGCLAWLGESAVGGGAIMAAQYHDLTPVPRPVDCGQGPAVPGDRNRSASILAAAPGSNGSS